MTDKNRGIADAVFLNAQNKHTIHRLAGPLRKLGIPTVCIYDLDIIKYEKLKRENTTLWEKILKTANISENEVFKYETERRFVELELDKKDGDKIPDPFTKQGLECLSNNGKMRALALLDSLKKHGIFIVPVGELEQWLRNLGIYTADKSIWLVEMLDKITIENIQPSTDDVWKFVSDINSWISDPTFMRF